MDRLPTELLMSIIDQFPNEYGCQAEERQATLAVLVRTCKRFRNAFNSTLYESPLLRSTKQAKKYLRTFTGWITPFSLAKGTCKSYIKPRTLSFDFPDYWSHDLPNLRLFDESDNFSGVTSLNFSGCWDYSHVIPHLLAPWSPLRAQLHSLTLHTTLQPKPPMRRAATPRSDHFVISFILEAALYLNLGLGLRYCPVTTARAVFPGRKVHVRKVHVRANDRELVDIDSPELEPWLNEYLEDPSMVFLSECRHDFDFFVSHFDYRDYEDLAVVKEFETPWAEPSPFSNLTSLQIAVENTTHLLLVLKTITFSSVFELTVYGDWVVLTDEHIILLRLAFTNYDDQGQESHGICYAPDVLESFPNSFISETNAFLFVLHAEHDFDNSIQWPHLTKEEVAVFAFEHKGPRLDLLDLSGLHVIMM